MFRQTFGAIVAASIAFVSLAGAIIGITISATNLKNDFELSKGRVAELEGQVSALRGELDKTRAGTPGPQGPAGPAGPEGPAGPKGDAGQPGPFDEAALRRVVASVVRTELVSKGASAAVPAGTAAADGTPQARADVCFDTAQARAGALVRAEEGAIFCDASGTIVMEVKDIDPTGNLAVGAKDDAGKLCKQCVAPWDEALSFQATKVEKSGAGYVALLEFAAK